MSSDPSTTLSLARAPFPPAHAMPPLLPMQVMSAASNFMVAWLRQELQPGPETDAGLLGFKPWVEGQRAEGAASFEIK